MYNLETKELVHHSGDMRTCMRWVGANYKTSEIFAVLENPALDKGVFGAMGMANSALRDYKTNRINHQQAMAQIGTAIGVAARIGESKASGKYGKAQLVSAGIPFHEVAPSQRDKAFKKIKGKTHRLYVKTLKMPTKTTQAQYNELTKFVGRTNEHERDAGTLVYARTVQWANIMATAKPN